MFKRFFTPKPQDDLITTDTEKRIRINHNSDGLTHLGGQKYSMVLQDVEYEWDIPPLYKRASAGEYELISFSIPPKFIGEWYWGDTTVEEHIERTLNADYTYPILVWDGQIIDGTHRCCLSIAAGVYSIQAYQITSMPPHDREYTPKSKQRRPHNQGRSHSAVIKKVQALMNNIS